MHPRADFLIRALNLTPHPEGGFFTRVYRSESVIIRANDQEHR